MFSFAIINALLKKYVYIYNILLLNSIICMWLSVLKYTYYIYI